MTRGTPPTPAIVRNIAEEIYGGKLGKHWVGQFIQQHLLHFKSMYLYVKYKESMKENRICPYVSAIL